MPNPRLGGKALGAQYGWHLFPPNPEDWFSGDPDGPPELTGPPLEPGFWRAAAGHLGMSFCLVTERVQS